MNLGGTAMGGTRSGGANGSYIADIQRYGSMASLALEFGRTNDPQASLAALARASNPNDPTRLAAAGFTQACTAIGVRPSSRFDPCRDLAALGAFGANVYRGNWPGAVEGFFSARGDVGRVANTVAQSVQQVVRDPGQAVRNGLRNFGIRL
jgi:hypothetical protein